MLVSFAAVVFLELTLTRMYMLTDIGPNPRGGLKSRYGMSEVREQKHCTHVKRSAYHSWDRRGGAGKIRANSAHSGNEHTA